MATSLWQLRLPRVGSSWPGGVFDHARLAVELAYLEADAAKPDLWDDPEAAQSLFKSLNARRDSLAAWDGLEHRARDLAELVELSADEDDDLFSATLRRDLERLEHDLSAAETDLLFSGAYDEHSAIVAISAGAGGQEATDWARMLRRMYLRWAERHKYAVELIDETEADGGGLRSATFAIEGPRAYGYLRAERGTHRLVRISPYDSAKRRQTSFALVEVLPKIEADDQEIVVAPEDIQVDTLRGSGPGGQNVNKVESAIRITHIATGIVVNSRSERSQTQNRESGMAVLRARLLERRLAEQAAATDALRGSRASANFGAQIRSYVLHPYQMVKDERTKFETSDTARVLDGDLDDLIRAELGRLASQAAHQV